MCTRLKKEVVPYEEAIDKWRYRPLAQVLTPMKKGLFVYIAGYQYIVSYSYHSVHIQKTALMAPKKCYRNTFVLTVILFDLLMGLTISLIYRPITRRGFGRTPILVVFNLMFLFWVAFSFVCDHARFRTSF